MKRRKIDSQVERSLLIALIMSKDFLSQALPVLSPDIIDAGHFRLVATWCLDYFKEYGEAPERHVETLYHSWVENQENPGPESDAIRDLLEDLSDEYDKKMSLNVPYLVDELGTFLSRRHLLRLQESLDFNLKTGDEEAAERSVLEYRVVEVGAGAGVDPLTDTTAWERAFSEPAQPLLMFPGDAGTFLNQALTRDSLVGIQGPEKRGKTWWCIEFVMRALMERRKVAFFQVGDLSENQLLLRLGVRLTGRPSFKKDCGTIRVPRAIQRPQQSGPDEEEGNSAKKIAQVDHRTVDATKPISKGSCLRACETFMKKCGISPDKPFLKVSVHPNSAINVTGLVSVLDRWEMSEGFVPDVVVIDYADILAPEDARKDAREQVNDTWKALRRLSQEKHCLVLVPTQSDAGSYAVGTQGMSNFSEDKRKLAHVTGMLGLNQSELEKECGIMRLNWIVLREQYFTARHCLWVGQCLTLGRAFCCGAL